MDMIKTAFRHLNKRNRVLMPESQATVVYRDFDPCKPVQIIATVKWPAIVNMRKIILTHHIRENDVV